MSGLVQSPTGVIINQTPIAPLPNVADANDIPDVQAVPAASNPALSHDDTADRQHRAIAAVKDALQKAGGIELPKQSKLVVRADKDSNRYVYEFHDPVTGEIIVQYPDQHVLNALTAYSLSARGVIVSGRA